MDGKPVELNHHYHDRGIKKYMGFFLSDHTSRLHEETAKDYRVVDGRGSMSYEEINDVLNVAILKNKSVSIQINTRDNETRNFNDDIIGKLKGYTNEELFLDDIAIPMTLIRNVKLVDDTKWYN